MKYKLKLKCTKNVMRFTFWVFAIDGLSLLGKAIRGFIAQNVKNSKKGLKIGLHKPK
jgi:hypothetical protein